MTLFLLLLLLSAASAIPLPDTAPLAFSLQGWSEHQPSLLPPPSLRAALPKWPRDQHRSSSQWTSAPPPPASIMQHALVPLACDAATPSIVATASLLLIGGSNASGAASASVLSFDIARGHWQALQPMPQPRQAAMAVMSPAWGGVVVCGGR